MSPVRTVKTMTGGIDPYYRSISPSKRVETTTYHSPYRSTSITKISRCWEKEKNQNDHHDRLGELSYKWIQGRMGKSNKKQQQLLWLIKLSFDFIVF